MLIKRCTIIVYCHLFKGGNWHFAWFDTFYLNFGLFFFRLCFESDAFQTSHDYDTAWDV